MLAHWYFMMTLNPFSILWHLFDCCLWVKLLVVLNLPVLHGPSPVDVQKMSIGVVFSVCTSFMFCGDVYRTKPLSADFFFFSRTKIGIQLSKCPPSPRDPCPWRSEKAVDLSILCTLTCVFLELLIVRYCVFQMSEGRKTQIVLLDDRRLEILIQVRYKCSILLTPNVP